jgi:hypothetical protein
MPTPSLRPALACGPPSTAVCNGIGCVDIAPLESVTTTNGACPVGSRVPPERVMSALYVLAPSPLFAGWPSVGTEYMNVGVGVVDPEETDPEDVDVDEEEESDRDGEGENRYGGVVYVGVGRTTFGSVVANVADSADSEYEIISGVSLTVADDKG